MTLLRTKAADVHAGYYVFLSEIVSLFRRTADLDLKIDLNGGKCRKLSPKCFKMETKAKKNVKESGFRNNSYTTKYSQERSTKHFCLYSKLQTYSLIIDFWNSAISSSLPLK